MILTARPDDLNSLYRIVSEFQIISYYLGITELPCIINAPYRPDRKPSLSIFQGMDGHIRFKDQARGDSGRVLDLLSLMWACTAQEAFRRLCRDLSDIRRVPDKKKIVRTCFRTTGILSAAPGIGCQGKNQRLEAL